MVLEGRYAASNWLLRQEFVLDTQHRCYRQRRVWLGWLRRSGRCRPLPPADYVLVFRTLYVNCEACSLQDFQEASTLQVSLVYQRNRRLIVHECSNTAEAFGKARALAQALQLRLRDSATNRKQPRWLPVSAR